MPESTTETLVEPEFDNGAAEATTQSELATNGADTGAGAVEATPGTGEQDAPSSLKTDQPTTPKSDPFPIEEAAPPVVTAPAPAALSPEAQAILNDPERFKRFVNLEKLHGQQANELGQLRKTVQQYDGIDPQQARAVLAEREQSAKQANLNPWNRGHNDNASFNQLRARRRVDDARLGRVAPEQREAVRAALEADYTPEELASLKQYDGYRQREEMMTPEDREDRNRETARQVAREELQAYIQYQEQTQRTTEFAQKHPDLLDKEQATLLHFLDQNIPRSSLAAEYVAIKAQLQQVLGNRGKELGVVETAKAQTAQAKQAAAIGRDSGAPRRKANPVASLIERKIKEGNAFTDDDAFDALVKSRETDPNE